MKSPKVVIGLGNPGPSYEFTRHNIGFRVLDALAAKFGGEWKGKAQKEVAEIEINDIPITLVKPLTYMNKSGDIISHYQRQGIGPEDILVIHDELEMPFGKLTFRVGGSARGHNGLKSIIAACGENFARLRFGIARPENKDEVPRYVLQQFKESHDEIAQRIDQAVMMIEDLY